jgi:hypothetical protein
MRYFHKFACKKLTYQKKIMKIDSPLLRLAETNHPSPAALRASASPTRGEAILLTFPIYSTTPPQGERQKLSRRIYSTTSPQEESRFSSPFCIFYYLVLMYKARYNNLGKFYNFINYSEPILKFD